MIRKILFCLSSLILVISCSPNGTEKEEKDEITKVEDQPVAVKALLLKPADFNYELISNGTIEALQKADLHFQSQENIHKIYVKNGDRVTKGQKIAELETFKLENSVKQAIESLDKARLDLQDVLIGQGYSLADSLSISPEVMRIAKIRSGYEQSLNSYKMTEYNLNAATLYAPFSGVVANIKAKEYNQPGNEAFCTIIENRHPQVVFNILESELPLVKLNDKLIVSAFSENTYSTEGHITEINPVVDKNGMVRLKASIDNREGRFYEGMNVKVRVQRLLGEQLSVPKSALLLRNNRKVIFTLRDGRAQWIYVQTTQENSHSYVVTEGLNAGDSIIYEGNFNLADQSKVIVK